MIYICLRDTANYMNTTVLIIPCQSALQHDVSIAGGVDQCAPNAVLGGYSQQDPGATRSNQRGLYDVEDVERAKPLHKFWLSVDMMYGQDDH